MLGLQLSTFFFLGPDQAIFSTMSSRGQHERLELAKGEHAIITFLTTLQKMSGGSWSSITEQTQLKGLQRKVCVAQEKHFTALFKFVLGWL
jgi:hypothetical protein